jgi:hypothetical protein
MHKANRLHRSQAAKAYDSVRETFSRNGIPSDEQEGVFVPSSLSSHIVIAGYSKDLRGESPAKS